MQNKTRQYKTTQSNPIQHMIRQDKTIQTKPIQYNIDNIMQYKPI